jgi:acyl-[acyl-carrier-protein]-phospholipid O-acyltransferase/long-chain-fatty-acid--[acyl-carrier-protein] ligase
MAPVIAVNIPDYVEGRRRQAGTTAGTVGHPIPGVSVRIVDPGTGEPAAIGQSGLLLAKGPNRMLNYFNDPEATAAVLRDGWFATGDTAALDENGFLRILARGPQ